jgi:ATP-dependent protease ClpP protease subunit
MRYIRPDVHTVCIGKAYGNAAMLVASGKKGSRYALPNSSIMLCPPRMNRRVDSATNLMIGANELYDNTTTYLEYLSEFTGKTKEDMEKEIERTHYFTPEKAIAYGLIDKVITPKVAGGLGMGAIMEKQDVRLACAVRAARALTPRCSTKRRSRQAEAAQVPAAGRAR